MLSTELAEIYIKAASTKQADVNLPEVRDQFEDSVAREELLRSHALRLNELAKARAAREDQSASGYAATAINRTLPIPHTAGEAAVRLPAMLAGGYLGHRFGKSVEPLDAAELGAVFSPKGGDVKDVRSILSGLSGGKDVSGLADQLKITPGAEISSALQTKRLPFLKDTGAALRGTIESSIGKGKIPLLRENALNLVRQNRTTPGTVGAALSKYRIGGAAGGALAAGSLVGLPFMIRALLQKRHGGEAAVRARKQRDTTLGRAEDTSNQREGLLQQLPK